MKKIIIISSVIFVSAFFSQSIKAQPEAQRIELCTKVANATFQSSYAVNLDAAADGQKAPNFKQGVGLRAKNKYRFTICNDEESAGEAILKVYDEGKLILSSYNEETGKSYQSINFDCNKVGIYIIIISFREGKKGTAVGILSHVKTL